MGWRPGSPFFAGLRCQIGRIAVLAILALAACLPSPSSAFAQAKEVASYQISVRLDPDQKRLQGSERITFLNDVSFPVQELYFHLYPNAFRSPDSTFMRENPAAARGAAARNSWGSMDVSALRLASGEDLLSGATVDDTVMRVPLPRPLAPGERLELESEFAVQMPYLIARMGYQGDQFTVAQWFPKLAALTEKGWNAHRYHANSEFFADFGSYRVEITLPEKYVVGASGVPAGERQNGDGTRTLTYQAGSVHDFAWVANPAFREGRAQVGDVEIRLLYPPEHEYLKDRFLAAAVAAVDHFGQWYGPYPYPLLTVADVPESAGAGMEYPTLVTVSEGFPLPGVRLEEEVTIHEIGHQWWYGMVASNEFEEAWLDEGFTSYSTRKLAEQLYGADQSLGNFAGLHMGHMDTDRGRYLPIARLDPMVQNSWDFYSSSSYSGNVYAKADLVLGTLEGYLGSEAMGEVLRAYFERYAYKHPTSQDFVALVREVTGRDFGAFFQQALYSSALFDYSAEAPQVRREADGYHSEVTALRLEDGVVPVEVVTTFQDGHQEREEWDGVARWQRYQYARSSPAIKVEVDPDHRLLLDARWSNNSYVVAPDTEGISRRVSDLFWLMAGWLKLIGSLY